MRFGRIITGLAAAAVAISSPLSAVEVRAAQPTVEANELDSSSLIGIFVFVAVVFAVYFIADESDNAPTSP